MLIAWIYCPAINRSKFPVRRLDEIHNAAAKHSSNHPRMNSGGSQYFKQTDTLPVSLPTATPLWITHIYLFYRTIDEQLRASWPVSFRSLHHILSQGLGIMNAGFFILYVTHMWSHYYYTNLPWKKISRWFIECKIQPRWLLRALLNHMSFFLIMTRRYGLSIIKGIVDSFDVLALLDVLVLLESNMLPSVP